MVRRSWERARLQEVELTPTEPLEGASAVGRLDESDDLTPALASDAEPSLSL